MLFMKLVQYLVIQFVYPDLSSKLIFLTPIGIGLIEEN